jgi:hypothetical protein
MMPQLLLTLTTLLIGGYLIYRWVQRSGQATDDAFRDSVLRDAATWLAQHLPARADTIDRALHDLIDHAQSRPILNRVLRIECTVRKTPDAAVCQRTVFVVLEGGPGALTGQITRDVGWEALPQAVRADFIQRGSVEQIFVVLENQTHPQ